jgi:glycosyltransferase involved in cell wall biosynthesis
MKILFVSSGNSKTGITPIVKSQGESLKRNGVDLDYFTIVGKGTKGYLRNIPRLKSFLKNKNYDLIHSHYSLSSIVASLSSKLPMVVSLMGGDTQMNFFWKSIIRVFYRFRWKITIVKSTSMKKSISLNNAVVIPNGVDFRIFKPIEKDIAKIKVSFNNKKHIIFVGNPARPEKNYTLAKRAVEIINNVNIELNAVLNVDQNIIPYYMNAADILLLTSLREGSPNVIKEAMVCNCPIVSTDVGDVKWVIGDTEGCYVCSFDPQQAAQKIRLALEFSNKYGRTKGRERIIELGLDSVTIAHKIINVYHEVLEKNQ